MLQFVDYLTASIIHAVRTHGYNIGNIEFMVRAQDDTTKEWQESNWSGHTMDILPKPLAKPKTPPKPIAKPKKNTADTVVAKAVAETDNVPFPTPTIDTIDNPKASKDTSKKKGKFGGPRANDWLNEEAWIGEAEYLCNCNTGNEAWKPVAILAEDTTHYRVACITTTAKGRCVTPSSRIWKAPKMGNKKMRNTWIYKKAAA